MEFENRRFASSMHAINKPMLNVKRRPLGKNNREIISFLDSSDFFTYAHL